MRNHVCVLMQKFGITFPKSVATLAFMLVAPIESAGSPTGATQPVIEFNKFRSDTFAPAFRVSVFSDGAVNYQGVEKVKKTGTHNLSIPTESVEKLVDAFIRDGFDTFSPPTSPGPADAHISLTISIAHPRLSRSVTFSAARNTEEYVRYLAVLDSYVPTRELRCPYVVQFTATSVEVCERADLLLRLANKRRSDKRD